MAGQDKRALQSRQRELFSTETAADKNQETIRSPRNLAGRQASKHASKQVSTQASK
jgi:hypothetical protein